MILAPPLNEKESESPAMKFGKKGGGENVRQGQGGKPPKKKWGGGPRSFAKSCPFLAANSFCKEMKEKKGGIGAFLAAVVTSLYLGINKSLFLQTGFSFLTGVHFKFWYSLCGDTKGGSP